MGKSGFPVRRRELEDMFFREHDEELLKALREQLASNERKRALADALGITAPELIDHLDELDLCSETLAALTLVPLIVVAWADGTIDVKERQAVMTAAEQQGLEKGHPGYRMLERWLGQEPEAKLLAAWKGYVTALSDTLSDADMQALKQDLLGRARAVAEAAGGLLGIGSRVSKSEQAVLDDLEQAFG